MWYAYRRKRRKGEDWCAGKIKRDFEREKLEKIRR